jgi:archaemetzincin
VRIWWLGAGSGDPRALEGVRAHVERLYLVRAELETFAERPAGAFDPRRGQHSSTRILAWMCERLPQDRSKALGLTDVDLFIPILTFVFGEAQLGGRAAVVSSARLGAGLPAAAAAALATRLAKEAAHELGHTFGLLHCESAHCVMSRSASLPDVDRKGSALCHDCQVHLADQRRGATSEAESLDLARRGGR